MPDSLHVPAWVRKDARLYAKVRRRSFPTQEALDLFLIGEAQRRQRGPRNRVRK